jgi:2-dehydro-3-deoxygalactonokinase
MTSTPPADSILIDWGTTNARAYRFVRDKEEPDKAARDRRRLPRGIRQVPPGGFPAALAELLGPWLDDAAAPPRILMSGMVGSRQGWVEASYRPCPARLADLAASLCAVPGLPHAHIVPGVCRGGEGAPHDVIRGEEVQVFGAVADDAPAVLCLPGTHSKWVRYADGALVDFATAMTGEVFQVLRSHSLLGALMPAAAAAFEDAAASGVVAEAFRHGLDRSGEPGGLLHHLFGVRAEGLFGAIPADGLEAYLSGLLIGHEIRAMAGLFPTADPVRLVADGTLAGLYTTAFRHLGRAVEVVDAEAATIRGLTRILEQAGLLA